MYCDLAQLRGNAPFSKGDTACPAVEGELSYAEAVCGDGQEGADVRATEPGKKMCPQDALEQCV